VNISVARDVDCVGAILRRCLLSLRPGLKISARINEVVLPACFSVHHQMWRDRSPCVRSGLSPHAPAPSAARSSHCRKWRAVWRAGSCARQDPNNFIPLFAPRSRKAASPRMRSSPPDRLWIDKRGNSTSAQRSTADARSSGNSPPGANCSLSRSVNQKSNCQVAPAFKHGRKEFAQLEVGCRPGLDGQCRDRVTTATLMQLPVGKCWLTTTICTAIDAIGCALRTTCALLQPCATGACSRNANSA